MQSIDFNDFTSSDLGLSRLFLDYLTDHQRVRSFFPRNFRNSKDWESTLRDVSSRSLDRSALVQVLSQQNRNFQCGVKTLANIDLLLNDNTVAIVTGQQVGMFTGPMYTLYKTLTAIRLAEQLGKRHPDHTFVPVFWIEGEDHDVEEVTSVKLFTATNDLATYTYPVEGHSQGKNLGAVGVIPFTDAIVAFVDQIRKGVTQTEFTDGVINLFSTAYQPGMTFTRAFVHLLNDLLGDTGLIYIDPNDAGLKKLLAPVFRTDLYETPRLCQLVVDTSVQLEQQYHAQVKPRPVNSFLFHNGGRFPIEPHAQGFALKGTRQHYSKEELLALLDAHPEYFSPNVVLRPLCQDTLLPTAAYVAGPAEVAYFAQIIPLYKEFGIPVPVIYPRASATILEEKVEKVLTRFALQPQELFGGIDFIKTRVAGQVSDFKAEELFGATIGSVEESLNSLRSGLQKIDPTLLGALDNTLDKMRSHILVLKQKTAAAQQRQHEVFMRQIDKASLFVVPEGSFQERKINVLYYLNKYGPEFVRWLDGELKIDAFKHQLIRL
ncbi:MAG: bacillithiol biosynthesis cysteine-adding enzyme BshC [Ignavibacteria bacterium GWA2_55_11]|nr:MAG: bacillithiol biosynthesis cysteine-adding enzyme BshC [Ignavibacteria bacterium GWA2_55_11]OGU47532.1 MAG: bacillithiol biosynthesis cysteine-adding enzyme BshC [Ignavibacteria bacterium GWC2_56_12]OGU67651.1 MAG: bacillithiol biosynthesis cysteine-adding enzyme BshC [Ignavibacteria bacterium RIFCSPHIGHO2_02_FULL_56_12]OGU70124.1 MAG: bacillithiol biosynthesis cysteine-adding enzyme BshC [Ignavibacteria bacterium RIFCSPLOWO2_02_FULL_55_14]OGU73435.1 MAG: bacillithiol biosynthesis cystei